MQDLLFICPHYLQDLKLVDPIIGNQDASLRFLDLTEHLKAARCSARFLEGTCD